MSKVLKEVTATIGQYQNAQGQTKYRYQRIGSVIETKNGPMLKLDVVPLKGGRSRRSNQVKNIPELAIPRRPVSDESMISTRSS